MLTDQLETLAEGFELIKIISERISSPGSIKAIIDEIDVHLKTLDDQITFKKTSYEKLQEFQLQLKQRYAEINGQRPA